MTISEKTMNIIYIISIVLGVILVIGLIDLFLVYEIGWLGQLFLLFLLILIVKNVIRLFVFPGSFWFWKRNVENRYAQALARRAFKRMSDAELIIEAIKNQKKLDISIDDIPPIGKTIQQMITTFTVLKDNQDLTQEQDLLLNLFTQVEQQFKQILIRQNVSLYDSFEDPYLLQESLKKALYIEQLINCQQIIHQIKVILGSVYEELSCWKSIERWLFNETLGSSNSMKATLMTTFKAQPYKIKSYDSVEIDCLHILNNEEEEAVTVFFCQPNAGYYEYMFYESEWMEYYSKRGINMFLWNYRGYGESQGFPGTMAILQDAEYLVDYLNQQLRLNNLIFHGESLGGMVACHLGKRKQAKLLFADRTFASISEIATVGFTKYARFFFNLFTSWNYDSCQAYLECPYYKVLAMDSKDEVVPYLSSLRARVGKQAFIREVSDDQPFSVKSKFYLIEKWRNKLKFMISDTSDEFNQLWYSTVISKEQMALLFEAIQRIQLLMKDLSTDRRTLNDSLNSSAINDSIEVQSSETRPYSDTNQDEEVKKRDNQALYSLSQLDRNSEQLQRFMGKVAEYFDTLETVAISLTDIFTDFPQKQQFEIFQDYLLSLFIWGSYTPVKNISRKRMTTLISQKLAFARLSTCLSKLELLIKGEKNQITENIIQDLEFIIYKMRQIRENFKKAQKIRTNQSSVSIEMTEAKLQFESVQKHTDSLQKNIGCFIPLQCGHNGILNQHEIDALDFHMSQAGILKQ